MTTQQILQGIHDWTNRRITDLEDTAVRTSSYDATVGVGLADNLRGDTIVEAEFYKRKTGGTQSVGSGIAAIKEVRGKSIVWNQLNSNFNEKQITASDSSGEKFVKINNLGRELPTSHKYYISGYCYISDDFVASKPTNPRLGIYLSTRYSDYGGSLNIGTDIKGVWFRGSAINPSYKDTNSYVSLVSNYTISSGYISCKNVQVIDLTLMFGAGNEPATIEEFEKMFPLDYYEYNAGEVIPFAGQNLVTIGKNQYNPTSGKANLLGSQQYQISGTYTKIYPTVTLVDYTYGSPVVSGTYYTNANSHYVGAKTVSAYDNTKTYALGAYCVNNDTIYKSNVAIETAEEFDSTKWDVIADVAAMISEGIFTLWDITPDANGLFTLTKDTEVTIVGGNDTDTMITVYGVENSAYEPYEKHTLPLDPSQWRDKQGNLVFPYGGMHGVGTAYDYAKVDADGYIRKAVRCFGQVDLGDLSYGKQEIDDKYAFVSYDQSYLSKRNAIVAKYNVSSIHSVSGFIEDAENKSYGIRLTSPFHLFFKDSSYTNADTFKAAMSGVPLIYELAEPVEIELATPVYAKYLVDKDGTEEITPANGTTPYTTPANLSILYAMDARGEIKNLPKNYLSKESAENMLNAMVSAGVIASYTMTYDATSGKYAFVIQKNSEQSDTDN